MILYFFQISQKCAHKRAACMKKYQLIRKRGIVTSFSCHSHSALCNVYLVALDRTKLVKIDEITMTMTGKTRYKVSPKVREKQRLFFKGQLISE